MNRIIKLFCAFVFMILCIPAVTHAHVLDGAEEFGGHYYKVIAMPMSWEKAKIFCESMGGHLATAETSTENEFIKTIVIKYDKNNNNGRGSGYWIGGYAKDNIWRWVTGKAITDYVDWIRNPSSSGAISIRSGENGKWLSDPAGLEKPFVCEWENFEDAHESTM